MALENTLANVSAWLATEVLAERFLAAYQPQLRFFGHIHHDSNAIARTESKTYKVRADPGQAPAGPGEGVALQNTYQVATGTNVVVTSTEFVGDLAEFSIQMIADALNLDINVVAETLTNGTQEQCEQLLGPFVGDMVYRALRAAEALALAQIATLTNTIGTSTEDWTLARMLACRTQFRGQQPRRSIHEAEYFLPEVAIADVENEVLAASGGVQGSIWGTPSAAYDLARNPGTDFMTHGLLGSFLNHRVYTIDPELNVTANAGADVVGMFGVPGVPGVAPDDPSLSGKCGAFVFYERMRHRVDYAPAFEGRGGKSRSIWHGGFGKSSNNDAVLTLVDAP